MHLTPVSETARATLAQILNVGGLPATVYVFRIDADGTPSFPFVSQACAEIYGFDADEAMADVDLMHEAVHPDDHHRFAEDGQHSLRTLQSMRWEGRIVRREGAERAVVVSSRPTRTPDGSTEWLGVVTERPRRPLPVDSTDSADLEVVPGGSRIETDAMAMLGHDVAAPITAILATAEFALDEINDPSDSTGAPLDHDRFRRRLNAIIRNAHRLNDLRDDFVTLAAADADVIKARSATVDVLAHLRAATDVESSGIKLVVECPTDLYCVVQPTHLQQMLGNLVSNALRYAVRAVVVSGAAAGDRVLITVKDDGPGLTPDAASRLFERFAHAGLPRRPPGAGTGLGLYIVRTLANVNGGTVLYTPNDTGTRFIVALPRASAPVA